MPGTRIDLSEKQHLRIRSESPWTSIPVWLAGEAFGLASAIDPLPEQVEPLLDRDLT